MCSIQRRRYIQSQEHDFVTLNGRHHYFNILKKAVLRNIDLPHLKWS